MASTSRSISSDADPVAARFAAWRAARRCALIPYLTSGYPTAQHTRELLPRLAAAGADILELGVPFSDPLADGPTIQHAAQAALEHGMTLARTLELLAEFRGAHDTPVVLFSYLNPILAFGIERFVSEAAAAGAAGVLVTDLPVGGDAALERALESAPLALVRLIAPTTTAERAHAIARRAQGFLYYIARTGVTGASPALRRELANELAALRAETSVPIAVGFGISSGEQAAEIAKLADGVVVGSALLDALDRGGAEEAERFLSELRKAMDQIEN